jgi:hypothetical protein
MKKNLMKTYVILLSITVLSSSCFKNFYLTNSQQSISSEMANKALADTNKYVFVHFADAIVELSKYKINNQEIEGEINKIEIPEFMLYQHPVENSSNRYKLKYEFAVLNEVHIYTNLQSKRFNNKHIYLTAKDITRVDVYSKDNNRTIINHVLSIIGLVASVTFGIGLIIALNMSYGGFSFTLPLMI